MNPRNTIWLLLAAGGLFAFIFFFERHPRDEDTGAPRVIPGLQSSAVSALEIRLAGQPGMRVELVSNAWFLTQPIAYPANGPLITNLLQAAEQLAPAISLTAEELRGHTNISAEYGLDHPQAILVFQEGGHQRQLEIGSFTAPGDQLYVELVGGDSVDVVDAGFLRKNVPRNLDDLRDFAFMPGVIPEFNTLAITGGQQGRMSFQFTRKSPAEPWRMTRPVEARADNPKLEGLLAQLRQAGVTAFVSDSPSADLDGYGLHPPALEISFESGTNLLLSAQFGKSPATDTNQVYARLGGRNSIVTIPRASIAPWLAGFQEFRDRHLVGFCGVAPDEVTVAGAGGTVRVKRLSTGAWSAVGAGAADAAGSEPLVVEAAAMNDFFAILTNISVVPQNNEVAVKDTVPNEPAALDTYGLGKPARKYILQCPPSALPAGMTNTVLAELDFGAQKDGIIYARRADLPGETSVYAVALADFQKLPWRQVDFQKRQVWDFSETNVASLSIRQDGKTLKLLRKGLAKWKIAEGSSGMIDELEVEVAAQELGALEAARWLERGDEKSAQYGFSDGGQQITVELLGNGKSRNLTLDLGGWSPDGFRYGRVEMQDGRNWIFLLTTEDWQQLEAHLHLHGPAARP